MIIHQLKLENFGVYERQAFDLTPRSHDGFNRPIILFRGQNGAGKTTLVEAIRLCLHGSLVLGDRVSRSTYEDYLVGRIHVPPEQADRPNSAKVGVLLDYVSQGRKKRYRIEREWRVAQGNVREDIRIFEDGEALSELESHGQKDSFLRELVPPGVTDLFFFDGEKLRALAGSDTSSQLLADTVKSLLGLYLVEQLQKDLDIYLLRHRGDYDKATLQNQFDQANRDIACLEHKCSELQAARGANEEAITRVRRAIAGQEQRIALQGSWFAERLEDLRERRGQLEVEIEIQRRQAQELANGLLPFAISPQLCARVAERLELEERYEQEAASRQVLDEQLEQLSVEFATPESLADIGIQADEAARQKLISKFKIALEKPFQFFDIPAEEIILRVSEQDRQTLLNWIDRSRSRVPVEFCQTIDLLNALEKELKQIDKTLQLVPDDEALKPLVEVLYDHNQELEGLQEERQDLIEQLAHVEYELGQMGYRQQRLRQQIIEQGQHDRRIQLVDRTRLVLQEFAGDLSRQKTALLEKRLVVRFNDLCRKQDLIDAVQVAPETFDVTLYRSGQPFEIEQLSAGERQLLAMATMWALREVSGLPLPIIADSPMGRLDSGHRFGMIEHYFPRASHQVILLATDTEIDDVLLSRLELATSRVYCLDYDAARRKTVASELTKEVAA